MTPFSDTESFHKIFNAWLSVLSSSSTDTVFLTPDWQETWYQELGQGGELRLLTLGQNPVVGIAPLLKQGDNITFVGERDVYDYCDFPVVRGKEREFFSSLISWITKETWEQINLFSIPEDSPTLKYLPSLAKNSGFLVSQEKEDVCPGISLPSTWDEYLSMLSKKDRHELRRKLRRLQSHDNVKFYLLPNTGHVVDQLDAFFTLVRFSKEDKRNFFTPLRSQFFRAITDQMAKRDHLRLFFLEIDGEKVASTLCFDYGSTRLLYNSGFNPEFSYYSVGLLLKVFCMKDAIEKGKDYFDFLRGSERYKYHLGAKDRILYSLKISR